MNISKHNKRNPSNWCSSTNLSVQSHFVPTHRRMLLQLLLVFATQISRTRTAPENCFGQFCLEEDYDKSRLPIHGYSPPPVSVRITPMLSEIFRVTDNDFSITFDATLKFNWIDNRIKFKYISDKVEGEFGDIPLDILNHIWVPPVQIQHMARIIKNEGDPLFQPGYVKESPQYCNVLGGGHVIHSKDLNSFCLFRSGSLYRAPSIKALVGGLLLTPDYTLFRILN